MAREVISECELCLMVGRSTQAMYWCSNTLLPMNPEPNIRICDNHYEQIAHGRGKTATER